MSRWITGPGGKDERHGVLVDTREAVLLDSWHSCVVHLSTQGAALALALEGRVNKRTDRSDVLYLMDGEGAARLVAEIVGVFARNGQGEEFMARLALAIAAGENEPVAGDEP